jgi:archaellum biogenesis ATPase FlaH
MIGSTDFEKIFFLYCLKNPKYLDRVHDGFFSSREIQILSDISKKFFERFNETPTKDNLRLISKEKYKDVIKDNLIDIIFKEDLGQFDEKWLKETSEGWVIWKNLDESLVDTIEYVKTVKVTPENVLEVVTHVKDLITTRNSISFDDNLGLDFFDPESHVQKRENKISSGHQWFDNYSNGGYDTKSLIVYAGEQNIGKSIWLANDASNFIKSGENVAFISAEMGDSKVVKRLGANLLNISMDKYDEKSRDSDYMRRKLTSISGGIIPPGELFIKEYPTSFATVPMIEAYLKDLESIRGIKLKAIVIDYINILSNYRNPNSENTYMTVKQIAQDLRAMAVRNNWVVITATQITRGGYDSTEINMSHISESAGLSHTADVMFAIIQDSAMHMNREYWLKILKIRDGQGKGSRCRYDINYEYMRLHETDMIITTSLD